MVSLICFADPGSSRIGFAGIVVSPHAFCSSICLPWICHVVVAGFKHTVEEISHASLEVHYQSQYILLSRQTKNLNPPQSMESDSIQNSPQLLKRVLTEETQIEE
jgi:hypothetical protein